MDSKKRKEDISKFQLRMSPKALEELDQLQKELEASTKAEVIRSSLKLVNFLTKEKKSGVKVILRDEKTGKEREILF